TSPCFTRKLTTTPRSPGDGSHLTYSWGAHPLSRAGRPHDSDKTAADQYASPGKQLLRLGECPPPGPICGICGGYAQFGLLESLDSDIKNRCRPVCFTRKSNTTSWMFRHRVPSGRS